MIAFPAIAVAAIANANSRVSMQRLQVMVQHTLAAAVCITFALC